MYCQNSYQKSCNKNYNSNKNDNSNKKKIYIKKYKKKYLQKCVSPCPTPCTPICDIASDTRFSSAYTNTNSYVIQNGYPQQLAPTQFTYGTPQTNNTQFIGNQSANYSQNYLTNLMANNITCNSCNKSPCNCAIVCRKSKSKCGKCEIDPCSCRVVCIPKPPCPIVLYKNSQVNVITDLPQVDTPICPEVPCPSATGPLGSTASGATWAPNTIPNVVNPWGLAFLGADLWVANEGTQTIDRLTITSTGVEVVTYNVVGQTGPQNPTGLVTNTNSTAFLYQGPNTVFSAAVIAVTLQGGIVGAAPGLTITAADGTSLATFNMYQNPNSSAIYTGVALTSTNLIVANFGQGIIETFSTITNSDGILSAPVVSSGSGLSGNPSCPTQGPVTGPFNDPYPVTGYAPFNVVVIGNLVYVLYAQNNSVGSSGSSFVIRPGAVQSSVLAPSNLGIGPGTGYINVFSATGTFIKRFASGGPLNAPWGMTAAPITPSIPAGSFMVGNQGDGTISIYDTNGIYLGKLRSCYGNVLTIYGLWSLLIGVSVNSIVPPNQVYFSAGIYGQLHGLIGYLTSC